MADLNSVNKKFMIKWLMAIFFFLYGTTIFAQTGEEEGYKAYRKAEKELNLVYNKLKNTLDKIDSIALVKSQKAWIQYRNADCSFLSQGGHGGVIANKMMLACKINMISERTKQLRGILKAGF